MRRHTILRLTSKFDVPRTPILTDGKSVSEFAAQQNIENTARYVDSQVCR